MGFGEGSGRRLGQQEGCQRSKAMRQELVGISKISLALLEVLVTGTVTRGDNEDTPQQVNLIYLAELIARLGSPAGLTLFAALAIRSFIQLEKKYISASFLSRRQENSSGNFEENAVLV